MQPCSKQRPCKRQAHQVCIDWTLLAIMPKISILSILYVAQWDCTLWSLLPMDACYLMYKSLDTTLLFTFTVQKYIYPSVKCMLIAGPFRVSVINWTLTCTTWSFLCVRDHSCALVGHTDSKSAHHFWLGKTHVSFSCAPDGVRTSGHQILNLLYQLSYPIRDQSCHWTS